MKQAQTSPSRFENSGFAVGAIALFAFRWSAYLTKSWGYAPTKGWGLALNFGVWLGIVLLAILADYGLHRAGLLDKSIRSGAWFAALFGPYAGMAAMNEWGHPVGSQLTGVISTLLAFWAGYGFDKKLMSKNSDTSP